MQKRNLILELTNSACIQSYMDNVLSFKSVIHTGIVIVERKKNLQNWAVYKYGFKHLSEGEIQNTEGKRKIHVWLGWGAKRIKMKSRLVVYLYTLHKHGCSLDMGCSS